MKLELLESRRLMAITPATVLTAANRQTLLNDLNIANKASLQHKLSANDLAGFDQQLLDYMQTRNTTNYHFQLDDESSIANYIVNNVGTGDTVTNADAVLQHKFPSTSSDHTYTEQMGSTIDWVSADPNNNEFLHALTRQEYWMELSGAYQYTGNTAYVNEMVSELAGWSAAYTVATPPTSWSKTDQRSWLLDMGIRTKSWIWAYNQVVLSGAWTKEANSLMLFKFDQQATYMAANPNGYGYTDNRTIFENAGALDVGDALPIFTSASSWATTARTALFNSLDGQIYNDGSQMEQSPGYASNILYDMVDAKRLDNINGISWASKYTTKLSKAVTSLYQYLTPDGKTPALGDTYPTTQAPLWLRANAALGLSVTPAKPRGNDVWILGTSVAAANSGNPIYPTPGNRGKTYAMTDSGNYIFRSGDDANARQISFRDGPKGGNHGHFDSLSFQLSGYGRTLLADPGPYRYDTSTNRAWAISTPAHNTVSLDGQNVRALEGSTNPDFAVDQYDVQSDHVQITGHHAGYSDLSGGPVVTRSIWYDYDGTMLIVDWVNSSAAHKAQTSFLFPGTNTTRDLAAGWMQSNNSGGNVRVQSIVQSGQASTYKTDGVFTSSYSGDASPATQFFTYQTGSFICFATLVTAFNGNTAPGTSAAFISAPSSGHTVEINLTKNGSTQEINFTPPRQTAPDVNGTVRGSYSDIAYDSKGQLHMAFYDRDTHNLKYTFRNTSGNWSIVKTIDAGELCGFDPSIAVDGDDHVGISYTDANNGDLKYAFNNGSSWNVQSVDVPGSTGHYSSLAFSRKDGAVISYYDKTHGDLKMATSATGGWDITTIDSGSVGTKDVGRFSSLKLDPSRPDATKWAIAYEDTGGGAYKYAIQGTVAGGTQVNGYTIFTVSASSKLGGYTSLAFDSANRPGISYYDSAISGLRYAHSSGSFYEGTSFSASTVTEKGAVGYYSNLYYNGTSPVIFYFDKTHEKVARAAYASKTWTVTNLKNGGREIHVARYGSKVAYTDDDESLGSVSVFFA